MSNNYVGNAGGDAGSASGASGYSALWRLPLDGVGGGEDSGKDSVSGTNRGGGGVSASAGGPQQHSLGSAQLSALLGGGGRGGDGAGNILSPSLKAERVQKDVWSVAKTGRAIIALDLHRCLLRRVEIDRAAEMRALLDDDHLHTFNGSVSRDQVPHCSNCGSRKGIKWGCDTCNVVYCQYCTRAYDFDPAPVEIANPEYKWYRTIITKRTRRRY